MRQPNAPDLFDDGMQLERTALAWQRTSLTLVASAVAAARVVGGVSGSLAAAATSVALITGALVALVGSRRYKRANLALLAGASAPLSSTLPRALGTPSGPLALLALLQAGAGLIALAVVVGSMS